eukprot:1159139-Pelagomonas_calceolata.AAC.15
MATEAMVLLLPVQGFCSGLFGVVLLTHDKRNTSDTCSPSRALQLIHWLPLNQGRYKLRRCDSHICSLFWRCKPKLASREIQKDKGVQQLHGDTTTRTNDVDNNLAMLKEQHICGLLSSWGMAIRGTEPLFALSHLELPPHTLHQCLVHFNPEA